MAVHALLHVVGVAPPPSEPVFMRGVCGAFLSLSSIEHVESAIAAFERKISVIGGGLAKSIKPPGSVLHRLLLNAISGSLEYSDALLGNIRV